ncbi:hypothetical protein ACNPQK_01660 [Acinetobacter guillouiae]|jgi:hypothetical protein|uniref:hypothetical protein n=1 Tax=Acinetobacter TaxID=469 RepID=UPI0002CEDAFF|nr:MULTISPECIES: hypothetical protein [Acinetobacter]MDN5638857.1 hypothetical protein [Staphylococcus equorum]ENU57972.1 hypothetical protein F981_02259 [Acinetobacter guillouiae CIP 63.46]EPH38963.1 hypothetical protein L291_0899 [Acinetobacter guillouiae MSP4-18]KAB0627067.1 hypothetical protein F7P82_10420 [Acinetobacter guillouiae]KQX02197.1 hypothetical protein ASC84_16590 [Acinetobacter sp. Root1280]
MHHRHKRKKATLISEWSTDQDCYLIENSSLPIEILKDSLSFSEEEILERKMQLGLVRQQRQMMRST